MKLFQGNAAFQRRAHKQNMTQSKSCMRIQNKRKSIKRRRRMRHKVRNYRKQERIHENGRRSEQHGRQLDERETKELLCLEPVAQFCAKKCGENLSTVIIIVFTVNQGTSKDRYPFPTPEYLTDSCDPRGDLYLRVHGPHLHTVCRLKPEHVRHFQARDNTVNNGQMIVKVAYI